MKCDLCSEPNPKHSFDATDFLIEHDGILLGGSLGEWMACDACQELIDNDEWDTLLERCRVQVASEFPVEMGRALIKEIHSQFRKHRSQTITE